MLSDHARHTKHILSHRAQNLLSLSYSTPSSSNASPLTATSCGHSTCTIVTRVHACVGAGILGRNWRIGSGRPTAKNIKVCEDLAWQRAPQSQLGYKRRGDNRFCAHGTLAVQSKACCRNVLRRDKFGSAGAVRGVR